MIRSIDCFLAGLGLIFLAPLLMLVLLGCYLDTGLPLYSQTRIGKREKKFRIFKFRTMRPEASTLPTHLIDETLITPLGMVLRRLKIDELPQLWNVLIGDMSLVGPRPCLPIQEELIENRRRFGIFDHKPGITGKPQILGVDMSDPERLVLLEKEMLIDYGLKGYFDCLFGTVKSLLINVLGLESN